ncbi:MAG: hypothetical protein SVX28_03465 [Pseudomonadota bacterium]|nr:hypothetical protein [Pseudomonadota bacterium]
MYAVEFEAEIRDGVVRIPEEYARLRNGHARVVVLLEDESEPASEVRAFSGHSVLVFKDNLPFDDFAGIPISTISSKVQALQSDELLLQPDSLREGALPERSKVMIRKTFVISKSVVIKRYGILEAGHFRAVHESFCRYFECCQL